MPHAAGQLVVLVRVGGYMLALDGTRNHYGGPPTCRVVIGSLVALLHGFAVSGTRSASVSVPAKLSNTRDVRAMAAARP